MEINNNYATALGLVLSFAAGYALPKYGESKYDCTYSIVKQIGSPVGGIVRSFEVTADCSIEDIMDQYESNNPLGKKNE